MVILPRLRACSMTAAQNSGLSFTSLPFWLSIHTLTKSAPLATISSTLARASSGVFVSEPGIKGADMKRYFTVRIRAPRRLPRCCSALKSPMSSGSKPMLVVGGDAIEGVLAQLRVALRVDVAVGVDDARQDELAGEIHNGCAGRSRNFGRRPHVADVAVLHHDGDVVLRTRTGAVNDCGMRESGDLRRDAHGKKQGRRQN